MEEQELIEAKRARNFIWTAAEKYEFEPMFLAFSPAPFCEAIHSCSSDPPFWGNSFVLSIGTRPK